MLGMAQKGVVGLTASNVRHGADGLWVVVCPPRVVIDAIIWHPVKPVWTPVAIFESLGVCIYVPASRHWLISYSPIHLT